MGEVGCGQSQIDAVARSSSGILDQPMAQRSYDGFISYSRLDAAVARRLRKRLESIKAPRTSLPLRMFLDCGVIERLAKSTGLIERVSPNELSTRGAVQLVEVYQRLAEACSRWQRQGLAKSFNGKAGCKPMPARLVD